ncbi:putative transposase [Sinorhizobium fredii]|nr:hypothetical protein AB395_00004315 [Sinorhizobium fredii CCBAU 45436]AWM29781.1 Mobile element protein [Sinorhizobium fredii CCBAU 25509]CCE99275.1 hypothetical protein SFHH103_04807 [Sinorhizobium fredii HH103]GEC35878.1 hypothetical protein EFR01_60490 [Sinorhizobium fredii]CEO91641.1 transposon-related [Sinorhizobium fredii HH103]
MPQAPLPEPEDARRYPDRELVEDIKAVIADTPTYGYRRVHAILRRNARKLGRSWPNAKRVYRVMKLHNLLLVRHTGAVDDRLHDGQVAVERSNIRWCSDGFEIGCDNKEKVRVAFALDCCDREAIAHVATTEGIKSEDVHDLVITAVENRFGRINMLSEPIEWLTDHGSCFIAKDTESLLRDIGMEPCTTPVRSPPRRSSKPSSAITSRSIPPRMLKPKSLNCRSGSSITTIFTRTVL